MQDGLALESNEQYTIENDTQVLTIKYANDQSNGNYSCIAKNRVGVAKNYQRLMVNTKYKGINFQIVEFFFSANLESK